MRNQTLLGVSNIIRGALKLFVESPQSPNSPSELGSVDDAKNTFKSAAEALNRGSRRASGYNVCSFGYPLGQTTWSSDEVCQRDYILRVPQRIGRECNQELFFTIVKEIGKAETGD